MESYKMPKQTNNNKWFSNSKKTKKAWGAEFLLYNQPSEYCCKVMSIEPGANCSIHFHKNKSENFCVIRGILRVEMWPQLPEDYGQKEESSILTINPRVDLVDPFDPLEMRNANHIIIPQRTPHRFTGLSEYPTLFVESSTFDEASDSYRIIESNQVSCPGAEQRHG